jgi:diguanylate cyclase (GGDEF)-like protein
MDRDPVGDWRHGPKNETGREHAGKQPLPGSCPQDSLQQLLDERYGFKRLLDQRFTLEMSSALFEAEDRELRRLFGEAAAIHTSQDSAVEALHEYRSLLLRTGDYLTAESRIHSELRCLALTDDLTGFYNLHGLLILGMEFLKLARRNGQSILLFFVDVAHFKAVNAEFGHSEGDALLVLCAGLLKKTFRDSDLIASLGGDEFAVLALESNDQSKEAILCRLESLLKQGNEKDQLCALALSTGVARFDRTHPVSLAQLLARASKDVYEQKHFRLPCRTGAIPVPGGE